MKRIALLLVAVSALIAGAIAPAAVSAQYPPPPNLDVSEDVGGPGFPFDAIVTGCIPGETVVFSLDGGPPVSVVCDSNSQAVAHFIAPNEPGTYTITATMSSGVLSMTITVVDAAGATTTVSGQLPTTGSSGVSTGLQIAVIALVAGVALFVVAQVRRRTSTS